jgi:putative restriction endonuclease
VENIAVATGSVDAVFQGECHKMPSISSHQLTEAIERALVSSGHMGTLISQPGDTPVCFLVSGPNLSSLPVWGYIKNLTPADRSDPDEYRIQLSSRILPLTFNSDGPTVLLGYHAELQLFVGFDPNEISTGARTQLSSGYVSLRVVKRARRFGMSFDRDRRNRIAVGLRPDMLVPYFLNAREIHAAADDEGIIRILGRAVTPFSALSGRAFDDDLRQLPFERQRLLRSVRVLARDAGFRKRVLEAYERRCAVSGIQLGLVEAAHILPISITGSSDHVQNGLLLLSQFHRAYDSGLIFLTSDYVMKINPIRVKQLRVQGLDDGIEGFVRSLGKIRLPRTRRDWPDPALIERANAIRGIGA